MKKLNFFLIFISLWLFSCQPCTCDKANDDGYKTFLVVQSYATITNNARIAFERAVYLQLKDREGQHGKENQIRWLPTNDPAPAFLVTRSRITAAGFEVYKIEGKGYLGDSHKAIEDYSTRHFNEAVEYDFSGEVKLTIPPPTTNLDNYETYGVLVNYEVLDLLISSSTGEVILDVEGNISHIR